MKYDAIVIGAGNGGLIAALTLQKKGKNVLLLENHNLPGGFATSFIRGRFEFEASLHELCQYGEEVEHGSLYTLFERLGLTDKIDFIKVTEAYHVITLDNKEEYSFPFGIEEYISKMEEYVPGSEKSMIDFFELAKEIKYALEYLKDSKGNPEQSVLLREYSNFMRVSSYSVDKVLNKLKMPKKAQELLSVYWTYLGSPTKELSFVHYASMLNSYIEVGAWIPKLRSHEISVTILEEFKKLGGSVRFLSKVTEVLMEEGNIIGVKCADEKKYYSEHIIANISPNVFYGSLMPLEKTPKNALKLCNARTLGAKGFCVYLGLNRSAEELGLKNYSYFLYHTLNSNEEFNKMKDLNHDSCVATVLNNAIPNSSPEGTCIICITSLYFGDQFDKYVSEENYYDLKVQLARNFIRSFENATGSDIESAIEEIEIATPVTFQRYGGHPDGVIYGYMAKGLDNLIPRLMHQKDEEYVKNVHFCGGFAERLSGYSSSYLTGETAALNTLYDIDERRENDEGNQD